MDYFQLFISTFNAVNNKRLYLSGQEDLPFLLAYYYKDTTRHSEEHQIQSFVRLLSFPIDFNHCLSNKTAHIHCLHKCLYPKGGENNGSMLFVCFLRSLSLSMNHLNR